MPKSVYRQRIIEQREIVILRTAMELFHLYGFAGVSMDMLAAQAGITKPTLYRHFKSKDEIAERLLLRGMQQIVGYIDASVNHSTPCTRLAYILRRMMLISYDDPLPLLSLLDGVGRAITARDEEARLLSLQIESQLSNIIVEGQRIDEIVDELTERAIINVMFALMNSINASVTQKLPTEQVREMIDSIERMFVRGISQ